MGQLELKVSAERETTGIAVRILNFLKGINYNTLHSFKEILCKQTQSLFYKACMSLSISGYDTLQELQGTSQKLHTLVICLWLYSPLMEKKEVT